MAEGHGGHAAQLVAGDFRGGFAGGKGAGGAEEGKLAAHAVGAERDAEGGAVFQRGAGRLDLGEGGAGRKDGAAKGGFLGSPGGGEGDGVCLIGLTP